MTLRDLKAGQSAVIESVGGEGATRQHFLDMGVIPGVEVTLVKFAPMGDPMELRLHGYELTLRLAEAEQIEIKSDSESGASSVGSSEVFSDGKKNDADTKVSDEKAYSRRKTDKDGAAFIMKRLLRRSFRRELFLPLHLREIRTVARLHSSISLPVPISMLVIFRELRLTERVAQSRISQIQRLWICPAFIRFHHILMKKLYPVSTLSVRSRRWIPSPPS